MPSACRRRDGHLVQEELELNFQPVVVIGEVDAVAYRDYTHARVAQVLELHQPAAVAPREAGEVLDHEYVQPVRHQLAPHGLIPLALLKGVARPVAVFVKHQLRPRELARDKVRDNGLLVLNRSVVPVKLLVNRYAAVPGKAERMSVGHGNTSLCNDDVMWRISY